MIELKSAQEARTIADNSGNKEDKAQLEWISNKILKAARKGEHNLYFYECLRDNVKHKLESLGYEIFTSYDIHIDSYYEISW